MLFSLTKYEELGLTAKDLKKINGILHPNGEQIFLIDVLDAAYWINVEDDVPTYGSDLIHKEFQVDYDGDELIIPAFLVSDDAEITVTVSGEEEPITDWVIEKVERSGDSDISTFIATYKSKTAGKHEYKNDDKVHVEIKPKKDMSSKKYRIDFEVIDSFTSIVPVPPFNLLDNVTFQVVQ